MRHNLFFVGIAAMLGFLIGLVPPIVPARANAINAPAVLVKQFSGTATDAAQTVTVESTSGQKVGATVSILVINDDGAGGDDLWISFNGTAADPGTTFGGGSTFAVKPGEKVNIDGQFVRASVRVNNAGQTAAIRLICSY